MQWSNSIKIEISMHSKVHTPLTSKYVCWMRNVVWQLFLVCLLKKPWSCCSLWKKIFTDHSVHTVGEQWKDSSVSAHNIIVNYNIYQTYINAGARTHTHTHTHTHTLYYHSVHAVYTVVLYMCEHTLLGTGRPCSGVWQHTECTSFVHCNLGLWYMCVRTYAYTYTIYISMW